MPRKPIGYWTYETCYQEAQKYKYRSVFCRHAGYAYKMALENNWLDDYSWFTELHKPSGYWDYERCYEEAKKYKSKGEFGKGNRTAYNRARSNNWLTDYTWFKSDAKPAGYWTYKRCYEEAIKYKSIKEFREQSGYVYKLTCQNGWIKDYTWLKEKFRWTYEACKEVAKQYKTKREFEKGHRGAYGAAREHGWLKDFEWFVSNRVNVIDGKYDNVYSYYFEDYNAIYIGRTIEPQRRDREHIFKPKNDVVARFAKEHNCPVPPMYIIEENLTLEQGQDKEDYWINYYREQGYFVLNSARTGIGIGSLGAIGLGKWTKNSCFNAAKKYRSRNEFRKREVGAYTRALKQGWLKDYTWFEVPVTGQNKWTEERCYEEALKFKTIEAFRESSNYAYCKAKRQGWLETYNWLQSQDDEWNESTCLAVAKEFQTLNEFQKSYPKAYKTARKNGWLDTYTWFVSGHVLEGQKRRKWDYDSCFEEAKKYKSRTEFQYGKGSSRAYKYARDNGWLDDYTWFEGKQKH